MKVTAKVIAQLVTARISTISPSLPLTLPHFSLTASLRDSSSKTFS